MGKFFVLSVVLILTAAFFAGSLNTDTQKVTGMQSTDIEIELEPRPCNCYEYTSEWLVTEFCPNNANRWKERNRWVFSCTGGSDCTPVTGEGGTVLANGLGTQEFSSEEESQDCPTSGHSWLIFWGWCLLDGFHCPDT